MAGNTAYVSVGRIIAHDMLIRSKDRWMTISAAHWLLGMRIMAICTVFRSAGVIQHSGPICMGRATEFYMMRGSRTASPGDAGVHMTLIAELVGCVYNLLLSSPGVEPGKLTCRLVAFHYVAVMAIDARPVFLFDEIHKGSYSNFFIGGEFAGYTGGRWAGF
jgi:hypothetical protein